MKRFTFILAAVLCLATATVNAQTYVGDINGMVEMYIPGAFTTNGQSYVGYYTYNSGSDSYNFSFYQDFTTHIVDINNVSQHFVSTYYDLDASYQSTNLVFTQNLFNTDNSFEYIEGDGVVIDWDFYQTALHIKSSNGSTLWSFNAEEGYRCYGYIVKLNNKYYLLVGEYNENDEKYHLYFISQGQGLTEVKTELPISVFPSIANRNQQITVELGEGNNAKEVTVVNGLGQVIKRMPVEEGQRQVTIPAQELNSGLNVVNSRTQQGQGSCKIIVQ